MQSKKYRKMMKSYKKELKKLAKKAAPWEYGFLEEYFITYLRFMKDYFELGENVWQVDETRIPIVESLSGALNAYNEYESAWDPFFEVFGQDIDDKDIEEISRPLPSKDINKILEKCHRKEDRAWNKFWKIVQKDFKRWWD